jgi:hypothetical protein
MKQNKIFQQQKMDAPRMSAFDLSREQKLTCRMGELVPTYLEEVLPGDQFRVKTESLVRFAPMLAPIMHRVDVFMHYFFVPNRIIWNDWEDFITGERDTDNSLTELKVPTYNVNSNDVNVRLDEYGQPDTPGIISDDQRKLADYLGLPVDNIGSGITQNLYVSQLPFRAYQQIYNDYYRDQNFEDEVDYSTVVNYSKLRYRKYEKDYFTSALPWPQRNATPVGVPIDVNYLPQSQIINTANDETTTSVSSVYRGTISGDGGNIYLATGSTNPARIENLSTTLDFQINELRKASALQRWFEKQALGGHRYIETIYSHFGVKSSDRRLQRAEYLGGGKTPVLISEVLNTSATTDTSNPQGSSYQPQGTMTGHAISSGESMAFQTQIEEHGYIMGIMSIMPKPGYSQGVPRHFLRQEKFDYFWPELANLGEQEVKQVEIYVNDTTITKTDADEVVPTNQNAISLPTFGYQQRYAEYKYGQNTIHGDFRNTLHYWHMARKFDGVPALNELFHEVDPEDESITNVFAVTDKVDTCWVQLYHDVKARRPMPYFANPSLI